MHQTQVQQNMQDLARGNVAGDALMAKFRAASRGDVKLACALRGYFGEGNDAYFPYLQSRIRPAITELVLAGSVQEMGKLGELGLFTAALTDEFLELAISARVPDSIVWLLKMKERRFGFESQELTL